ncbi:MAG: hypothetical protein ACUZ8N_11800 [Candidatus Scalindua sp.]
MENNFDKKNFLNWYCCYATPEEIEKAERTNKAAINRLVNEYSYELEKINTTKSLFGSLLLPKGVMPEFLLIDCL